MADNNKSTILDSFRRWFGIRGLPVGGALDNTTAVPTITNPVPNVLPPTQKEIQAIEPFGTIPAHRTGRISGFGQVQNVSQDLTVEKVQAAFRAAERGDTRLLFTYYRDMFLTTGPVAAELQKRKLSVISQPYKILPADKTNSEDVKAAQVIQSMIDSCPCWRDNLIHLMNAIIFPVSIAEKIYEPFDENKYGPNKFGLRYTLKELAPVDYQLLCYRLPYLPGGPLNPTSLPVYPSPPLLQSTTGRPESTIFDPDAWEPWLRFWSVLPNGLPIFDFASIYEPDPARHLIYRSHLFSGIAPDNFGGLGRAVMFWAIMAQFGKEYWLRYQDQFGSPFIIAKVDTAQIDTVEFLTQQFALAQRQHALIVNKDADLDLAEAATQSASEGHQKFVQFCHDQIAILISGQTLSTSAKSTGLGSGVANLQSQVRDDIVQYDRESLGSVLRNQVFSQFLKINGFTGCPPIIKWGGSTPNDAKLLSDTLAQLSTAGLQVADDSLENISERLGFTVEKVDFEQNNQQQKDNEHKQQDDDDTEDTDGTADDDNDEQQEAA